MNGFMEDDDVRIGQSLWEELGHRLKWVSSNRKTSVTVYNTQLQGVCCITILSRSCLFLQPFCNPLMLSYPKNYTIIYHPRMQTPKSKSSHLLRFTPQCVVQVFFSPTQGWRSRFLSPSKPQMTRFQEKKHAKIISLSSKVIQRHFFCSVSEVCFFNNLIDRLQHATKCCLHSHSPRRTRSQTSVCIVADRGTRK